MWPWRWLVARRCFIAEAQDAMRDQLQETRKNNARNREVLATVRKAASLSHGGSSGG